MSLLANGTLESVALAFCLVAAVASLTRKFAQLFCRRFKGDTFHPMGKGHSSWAFTNTFVCLPIPLLLWMSLVALLNYTIWAMNPNSPGHSRHLPTAVAVRLTDTPDADGFPTKLSWKRAIPVSFDQDWKGENPNPARATEVRLLWTPEMLFLRFQARYQSLSVYDQARADGWRDHLWDRDVVEAFLQPEYSDPLVYKEFEIGPNGFWIALNISHGEKEEMRIGLRRRVVLDEQAKTWIADLAVPLKSLTSSFDANQAWRVNFYRVEGEIEPRFYSAWSATYSQEPNFHVPSAFGKLRFRDRL